MPDFSTIYQLEQFIDTFALGHYARVLDARDVATGAQIAFKILRPEHLSPDGDMRWEYRAFANEAALLTQVGGNAHIVPMRDCGFISAPGEVPLGGEIVQFGTDTTSFVQAMPAYAQRGWRPYLALEPMPRTLNLLYLMRPDKSNSRWRLPSEEGLALAIQFAETLQFIHRMGIAYLDHKLEHVYWDGTHLQIIDFNSSRQLDRADAADYFRLDIHNLCVGVLYPLFTGMSPRKAALRPQPGTREEAEVRYQDITQLDFGLEPTLSVEIQQVLQRAAEHQISSADEFLDQLRTAALSHGWDFADGRGYTADQEARSRLLAGVARLREGQGLLREARDLFREAAVVEDIGEDMDAELRRLVRLLNDMLSHRVIP